jgi:hypothetical protein
VALFNRYLGSQPLILGTINTAVTAMMTNTTINSINVNPFLFISYSSNIVLRPSVAPHKLLYRDRHSGLDPESSVFNWIPAFAGMTILIIIVNKC